MKQYKTTRSFKLLFDQIFHPLTEKKMLLLETGKTWSQHLRVIPRDLIPLLLRFRLSGRHVIIATLYPRRLG